jgi:plastocyanin
MNGFRHGVTADDNSFVATLNNSAVFSYTFTKVGKFPYYCQFHGEPGGGKMSGTINVVSVKR